MKFFRNKTELFYYEGGKWFYARRKGEMMTLKVDSLFISDKTNYHQHLLLLTSCSLKAYKTSSFEEINKEDLTPKERKDVLKYISSL